MTLPRSLRDDFPVLARKVGGAPLVYLDSAATSQKPRAVLDAIRDFYEQHNANAGRGVHRLAEEATEALSLARASVRRFIGAARSDEVVFTRGTTESLNLVAAGWARGRLARWDEIVLTEYEHHANLLPWQRVARETGAVLRFFPAGAGGALPASPAAAIAALIGPRTRLVAFSQVSNAVGTLLPARELCEAARARGAAVLIDAAQSAPHLPLDVRALGCDFLAFSAHKALGPTGVGVLYARRDRQEEMEPMILGGGIVREVFLDRATLLDGPARLEAGTQPVAEAVGLGAAIAYLEALGMEAVRAHGHALADRAVALLRKVRDLTLYGPQAAAARGGVVAFNLRGVHPHDLAAFLDERGIAVRAGHHCAQPLHRKLGLLGSVRASFHVYTQPDEIDALAQALDEAHALVR
ncbi:MAG: cysteine desulfurase [Myxococcales bacterium]